MKPEDIQGELFGLIWRTPRQSFRLHVNDIIRISGRLCRVIRVTESAAVVLVNQPRRVFKTRFDKRVRFQPGPATFRISANAETEILNRKGRKRRSAGQVNGHAKRASLKGGSE